MAAFGTAHAITGNTANNAARAKTPILLNTFTFASLVEHGHPHNNLRNCCLGLDNLHE
jgi:hypothetical protein